MTSFISTLSLFVLVFATGCFTLPVTEEPFLSSTYSSLINELTTVENNGVKLVHTRLIPDQETTESLKDHSNVSLNEESVSDVSIPVLSQEAEENSSLASNTFDELTTLEPSEFTTEDLFLGAKHDGHDYDDSLFTTVESVTDVNIQESQSVPSQDKRQISPLKRELIPLELTTGYTPSFTSTSSVVAPQLYTLESSTEKYIGLLRDETNEEIKPEKHIKSGKKLISKSIVSTTIETPNSSEDKSEEDSKELNVAVAQLDQQALDNVSNIPNDVMILEETVDVVTLVPEKLSTTTIRDDKEHDHEHEDEREDRPLPKPERKPKLEHDDEREDRPLPKPERKPKLEHDDEREDRPLPKPERESESVDEHRSKPKIAREPEDKVEDKLPKPLNQGKKSSFPEEKEPDH